MKWRELMALCDVMKKSSYRKPGFQDLELTYNALLDKADENGENCVWVTRNQFISVLKVRTYGGAKEKNLHRLFSSFDTQLKDKIDVRHFMASMRTLWKPSEPIKVKAHALFSLFMSDDNTISTQDLYTIFLICAVQEAE